MAEEITFKCLRCGYEFQGPYDRKVPKERECPKCGSNSIRPLPKRIISLVLEWAFEHRDELMGNWKLVMAKKPLHKIPPLV